jgi:glycosyltransferase involved in cell wall biosynthesis
MRLYSVIVPVYNRPQEVLELLESLVNQTYSNFEVIIVEDGSNLDCKEIVESFSSKLDITYFFKDNSGQGFSRNFGFDKAKGDYFIVFDSDCLIPENYFETVEKSLEEHYLDAYGGPDREHESFTNTQKAISYSMTSLFTTGGIRGRKGHVGQFHPRSFNMGISREVYEKTGGYIITRMGEDIEFSIRILANGFKVGLIPDAFVYHKRRTNLAQFYKQLHFFGRARINIGRFFKNEIKVVHLFPAAFLIGLILTILGTIMFPKIFVWFAGLFGVYFSLIAIDSLLKNKNLAVAIISLAAALIQLSAYGIGFITEGLKFKRSK